MLNYILTAAAAALNGAVTLTEKAWQRKTEGIKCASAVFMTLMAACSVIIFYFMSGFDISVNFVTIVYSLLYTAAAILSIMLALAAISRINLILFSVFSSSKTVLVWLIGILFMNEIINAKSIISAALFTVSMLLPLADLKNNKTKLTGYLIGISLAAVDAATVILMKFYTANPDKMSDSTMCFYTNVFMFAFLILYLVFSPDKRPKAKNYKGKSGVFLLIPLCTLSSNLSSVLQLGILKTMPVSHYSVLIAALNCIVVFINSKVIFRESCRAVDIICLALSTAAVIITVI